ncbi:MAG TPA: aspartate kinase [Anaerolineaceae bacterium]
MSTLVMKFGGTSVGTPAAMAQVVKIIQQHLPRWQRMVVVTSALSGVTDLLLNSAAAAAHGDTTSLESAATKIRTRHAEILGDLLSNESERRAAWDLLNPLLEDFTSLCRAIAVLGEATPRALDAVASLGERLAVRTLAAAIQSAGTPACYIDATELIVTDDAYQSALPNFEATGIATRTRLEPVLAKRQVAVVTGFIGATPQGVTTTLGRGGSDYTAAILGAALPADEVWIWTDVDGVMTADPRLVPDARTIRELSFREVGELAYFGAKVLHPKTIRPVIEAGIGLKVLNTFNPDHPGTSLIPDTANQNGVDGKQVIKAVTAIKGLSLVTLEGRGMLGVPGVAARTFAAIASTQTSVPLISQASSEQSICFAVPIESAPQVIAAVSEAFEREMQRRDIDRVWATGEVVIISVVGAGMRSTPGVSGKVFSALGNAGVNVIAIAQGSSEVSISFIVSAEDAFRAVQVLHQLI